jgi:hypothetical protein
VATLRGILAAHGEEHFTLTVRTIIETEGNARAMVAPVLLAISDVLLAYPNWASTTAWLDAFDAIDLLSLLRLARPLCNVSKQKPRAAIGGMLVQLLQPNSRRRRRGRGISFWIYLGTTEIFLDQFQFLDPSFRIEQDRQLRVLQLRGWLQPCTVRILLGSNRMAVLFSAR